MTEHLNKNFSVALFDRMKGIRKVIMVEVLEGKGTPENVMRIVQYFYYCDTLELIGVIDPVK